MACTINNFSTTAKSLALSKNDADHRILIRHLYRRLGYGASLPDIKNADNKTISALVDELISNAMGVPFPTEFDWIYRDIQIPARSLNVATDDVPTVNGVPQNINEYPYSNMIVNYWVNESIVEGVRSKLMLFWHNHFVTGETDHDKTYAMLRYFKILFENAFGDFQVFVKAIGRTPRMLRYLNGDQNTVIPSSDGNGNVEYSNPNENYARELLELFTMGIKDEYNKNGEDNYTPDDINQLAKALTGWRVAQNGLAYEGGQKPTEHQFRFQYGVHDWNPKDFLGSAVYDPFETYWKNQYPGSMAEPTTIPGNNGEIVMAAVLDSPDANDHPAKKVKAGDGEYQHAHDIIFTQRADQIAYFICEKLYKFYVYADIDAETFPYKSDVHGYIMELADKFKAADEWNWNIAEVLKAIFKSKHFYDPGIIGGQIKSHLESAVSFFHTADLKPSQWEPTGDGSASEIINKDTYDYKYRLTLLEPHLHDTNSFSHYLHSGYVGTYYQSMCAGCYDNENHVTNEKVNAMTGERGTPHDVYYGLYRSLDNSHPTRIAVSCGEIGQTLLFPPNVAGWAGHHYWLNEYTLIKRRAILESYLTSSAFGNTPTGYYSAHHGFRLVTKKKFRELAKELVQIEYSIPDNEPDHDDYTDSEKVVSAIWKHFFCVEPTDQQLLDAVAAYEVDWDDTCCTAPNINPPAGTEENEMALRVNNLLLHFIRQPEYQLT